MDDLRLPVIKREAHKEKRVSMDDYARFVLTNMRYCTDISAARLLKEKMYVSVPFHIKD